MLVAALMLSVLVFIFSFVVHTGNVVAEKARCQFALDAAAMAGVFALCMPDPVSVAIQTATENGLRADEIEVLVGFYDTTASYDDFDIYKNFKADNAHDLTPQQNENVPRLDAPGFQFNNAVAVRALHTVPDPTGGLSGLGKTEIKTSAVAFLKRYDMLAVGTGGIRIKYNWFTGQPVFLDMRVHSNDDITFKGKESFDGDSTVTATGSIINGPGNPDRNELETSPINWDMLKCKAEMNGRIYTPSEWGEGTVNDQAAWTIDAHGNEFVRSGSSFFFCPKKGDHNGGTYYFSSDGAGDMATLYILNEQQWRSSRACQNLTIAAEMNIRISHFSGAASCTKPCLALGGTGPLVMRIYSKGDLFFRDRLGYSSPVNYQCDGVLFFCEKKMEIETHMYPWAARGEHRLRVFANRIEIKGQKYGLERGSILFDGLFSSPCRTEFLGMANLVPAK